MRRDSPVGSNDPRHLRHPEERAEGSELPGAGAPQALARGEVEGREDDAQAPRELEGHGRKVPEADWTPPRRIPSRRQMPSFCSGSAPKSLKEWHWRCLRAARKTPPAL
eukprot:2919714-Pyramimonas_sp.AAC.1